MKFYPVLADQIAMPPEQLARQANHPWLLAAALIVAAVAAVAIIVHKRRK